MGWPSPAVILRNDADLREVMWGVLRIAMKDERDVLDRALTSRGGADETDNVLGSVLRRGISIPRPDEVRAYLRQHPDMVPVVEAAGAAAVERVQEGTQLSLELYQDPEIEDEHLALYLRQSFYDVSVLQTLDEIRSACQSALSGRSGRLCVTTDFRPPG